MPKNANANSPEAGQISEFHIFAPLNAAPAQCRLGWMPPLPAATVYKH